MPAGRCHHCNVVFDWDRRKGRLVRDAWCPRCGRHLQQTAISLIINPTVDSHTLPIFSRFETVEIARLRAGNRSTR